MSTANADPRRDRPRAWQGLALGLPLAALAIAALVLASPIAPPPPRPPTAAHARTAERNQVLARVDFIRREAPTRLARIRPVIAGLLGAELEGDIPIVLADRTEWAAHAAEASFRSTSLEELNDTPRWRWARKRDLLSATQATGIVGTVPEPEDTIWLLAANIAEDDFAVPTELLDAVLAHEIVHVHQHRTLGLRGYVDAAQGNEERLVRRAVLEGHAEWVTRQAAPRLGIERGFERLARRHADTISIDQLALHEAAVMHDFRYRDGEEFVRAVMDHLGVTAGLARLRSDPPQTVREILGPALYLERGSVAADAIEIPARMRVLFDDTDDVPEPVLTPLVEAALQLAGREAARAAVSGLIGTRRVAVQARFGGVHAPGGHLLISRFADEDHAHRFVEVLATTWSEEGAPAPAYVFARAVHSGTVTSAEFAGEDAIVARLQVQTSVPLDPIEVWAIAFCSGRDVLLCTLSGNGLEDADLHEFGTLVVAAAVGGESEGERLRNVLDLVPLAATGRPPRDELLRRAADASPRVRWAALAAADSAGVVQDWPAEHRQRALNDSAPQVRALATRLLLREADPASAVDLGLERLRDADPRVRTEAVTALAKHTETTPGVLPALTSAADDPAAGVRLAVIQALGARLSLDRRLAATTDPDRRIRSAAVMSLGTLTDESRVRTALLAATRDSSAEVRGVAWNELVTEVMLRHLSDADARAGLADPSPGVRMRMLSALLFSNLARPYESARNGTGDEPDEAESAGAARGEPDSSPLAAAFDELWADADRNTRAALLQAATFAERGRERMANYARQAMSDSLLRPHAIGFLGHESATAQDVDLLTSAICAHSDRAAAARALGEIGSKATRAMPLLRTLVDSPHASTRQEAALALAQLGDAPAPLADVLVRDLGHEDPTVRFEAIAALGRLPERHDSAIAAIVRALADPHPWVRESALDTIGMGREESLPDNAAEAIGRCLLDESRIVRGRAARLLDDSGPWDDPRVDADPVRPFARRGLSHDDTDTRIQCALFLARNDELSPELVSALREGLQDDFDLTRCEAVMYLGYLVGSDARLLPEVTAAFDDPSADVRGTAVAALLRLRPLPPGLLEQLVTTLDDRTQAAAYFPLSEAIEALDADVVPILPVLVRLLDGSEDGLQSECCQALVRLGYAPETTRPSLERLLTSEESYVRYFAQDALDLPTSSE